MEDTTTEKKCIVTLHLSFPITVTSEEVAEEITQTQYPEWLATLIDEAPQLKRHEITVEFK